MASQRGGILARAWGRLRLPHRADFGFSVRITTAAVLSYVAATLLFPDAQPLLAPLTAMLVVQVTPASLLAQGLDRVLAVVAGVSIAVGFAARLPLEWWTLGLLILVALTVGQVLRLGSNLLEVAISGMLVLGVGALGVGSAAWERLTETLVGAAVAVAANLLFPPKVATEDAGQAIHAFADQVSGLLSRAADELRTAVERGEDLTMLPSRWLNEARATTREFPTVEAAVLHAEQGRLMNVRAVFTADAGPGLRQGLEALEHTAISIRSMFRAVVDAMAGSPDLDRDTMDDIALGLAQTLTEMAAGVDAFGQVVRAEAAPGPPGAATDVQQLAAALDGLHEARARLEELLASTASPPFVEFTAALLTTVRRLLQEMDLDQRMRRQVRLGRAARQRGRASSARTDPRSSDRPGDGSGDRSGDRSAAASVDPEAATEIIGRVKRHGPD